MKIQTGTPFENGRYIVYVDGLAGWCEPKILTWKGGWFYYHSTEQLAGKAHGWIGPLPILEIPKSTPAQEFDL